MNAQRHDLSFCPYTGTGMRPKADGRWVLYEVFAAAAEQLDELRAEKRHAAKELERARATIDSLRRANLELRHRADMAERHQARLKDQVRAALQEAR